MLNDFVYVRELRFLSSLRSVTYTFLCTSASRIMKFWIQLRIQLLDSNLSRSRVEAEQSLPLETFKLKATKVARFSWTSFGRSPNWRFQLSNLLEF